MDWDSAEIDALMDAGEPVEVDGARVGAYVQTPDNRISLFESAVIIAMPQATVRTVDVIRARRGSVLYRPKTKVRYVVREKLDQGVGVTILTLRED